MEKFEYFLSTFHLNKALLKKAQTIINKAIKSAYRIFSKCFNNILISQGGLNLTLLEIR